MEGLSPESIRKLQAAARAIRDGAFEQAETILGEVLAHAPDHPEALRLMGIFRNRLARPDLACEVLGRALALRPEDPLVLNDWASALFGNGEKEKAFEAWRAACALAPDDPVIWFNLARNLQAQGATQEALPALERVLALKPQLLPARILLGDAQVHLGRFEEADATYRAVLRVWPSCGDAWRGLSNIKTFPLSEDDLRRLTELLGHAELPAADRVSMGLALGKACEDSGRWDEAFAAFDAANALARSEAPWDAGDFHRWVETVIAACATLPAPEQPELGKEVLFIVGMPRSGSTLVEQILASHPQVEGASELTDLAEVILEESRRRQKPFPAWVPEATATDWSRLGRRYLSRTAHWRRARPRSTDKMPENWLYAGTLRAMLPGARVIESRRDPVEVGWSCFKQHFQRQPHFSCALADIAAYTKDCARAVAAWRTAAPERVTPLRYEALLADPEGEIRALLDFCELPFDAACLRFHESRRSVRTASAAQVRQPLRKDTARSSHYGARLEPLRTGLGLPTDAARRTFGTHDRPSLKE